MSQAEAWQRLRMVLIAKAALALAFLAIVWLTMPNPVSLSAAALDLALLAPIAWLGKRHPQPATYLLIAQTALFLTPRQFVQGYVNGVNWVIYVALPMIAVFVLRSRRAAWSGLAITLLVALPAMLSAALVLPPAITRADVLTLIAFVGGVMTALALVLSSSMRG
ncbi:MAG: hypothetical protein ACK4WM_08960 [Thermoflexales bacterium]